jgi:hypothetical protein
MGKLPSMRRWRVIKFKQFIIFKLKSDGAANIRQSFKSILGFLCRYVQITNERQSFIIDDWRSMRNEK